MIFVRNENGSHNPEEAMEMEDFAAATRAVGQVLLQRASEVVKTSPGGARP